HNPPLSLNYALPIYSIIRIYGHISGGEGNSREFHIGIIPQDNHGSRNDFLDYTSKAGSSAALSLDKNPFFLLPSTALNPIHSTRSEEHTSELQSPDQ